MDSHGSMGKRRHFRLSHYVLAPIAVFLFAFGLRLVYMIQASDGPFFEVRGLDGWTYHNFASWFVSGVWPDGQPFARPPLFPFLLGVIYRFVGDGVWTIRLLQASMGAASCVLTLAIGRMVLDGRLGPVLAALVCSLHGTLIFFDAQLLPASLDCFLELLVVYALLRADLSGSLPWWIAAGVFAAASALTRGSVLLFVPFVMFWILCARSKRRVADPVVTRSDDPRRSFWKPCLAFVVPIVLLIMPVAAHNARYDMVPPRDDVPAAGKESSATRGNALKRLLSGRFVPIASNSGVNFYLGNHYDSADLNDVNHPRHFDHYDQVVAKPIIAGVEGAAARDRYLVDQTLSAVARRPVVWCVRVFKKLTELINGAEIARNSNLYAHRQYSWLLYVLLWKYVIAMPNGVIIPLAIIGMWLERRGGRTHILLIARLLLHALFILSFFVTARYRVPAIPLLAIYAARAVVWFIQAGRCHARGPLLRGGIALLVLLALCNFSVFQVAREHGAYEYDQLAHAVQARGDLNGAIELYRKVLSLQPESGRAHNWVGHLLLRCAMAENPPRAAEMFGQAEHHLRLAVRHAPLLTTAHSQLGTLLAKTGRAKEALTEFAEAVRIDPEHADSYYNIGVLLQDFGDHAAALDNYDKALSINPQNRPARRKREQVLKVLRQ